MKSRKIISAEIKEKYRPKRSGGAAQIKEAQINGPQELINSRRLFPLQLIFLQALQNKEPN